MCGTGPTAAVAAQVLHMIRRCNNNKTNFLEVGIPKLLRSLDL